MNLRVPGAVAVVGVVPREGTPARRVDHRGEAVRVVKVAVRSLVQEHVRKHRHTLRVEGAPAVAPREHEGRVAEEHVAGRDPEGAVPRHEHGAQLQHRLGKPREPREGDSACRRKRHPHRTRRRGCAGGIGAHTRGEARPRRRHVRRHRQGA